MLVSSYPKGPRTQIIGLYGSNTITLMTWQPFCNENGPNNRVLCPKYDNNNGIWALNPIIWVLRPLGLVFCIMQKAKDLDRATLT